MTASNILFLLAPSFPCRSIHVVQFIDITVRDRKLKFPPNQNVLRHATSWWSMRITARSSQSSIIEQLLVSHPCM